jgi:DNA helicase-2/ATP-dependent DNA helicase PcrA
MSRRVRPKEWVPTGVDALERNAEDAVRDTVSTLVVAGPGAGKTELLAQRASYLLETRLCAPPRSILAISFKRDAAKNLRDRVKQRCGSIAARRFHSYTFDAFAKGLVDRLRMALPDALRPSSDYVIDFALARGAQLRDRLTSLAGDATGVTLGRLQEYDARAFFDSAVVGRELSSVLMPDADEVSRVSWAFWQSALRAGRKSALNFQMLGTLAELLLRSNPMILHALRGTYAFVFLDEFQDTTGIQYRLLHTAFHGSETVLTAVGDHKQRIMLWAGALEGVFDAFRREFNAELRGLEMNYRSAPRLVHIQRYLVESLDPRSAMPRAVERRNGDEGECRLLVFPDNNVEADSLGTLINTWIHEDGVAPNEICVLVRKLADLFSAPLRAALSKRGIASRVEDELQDLLTEPIMLLACAFVRLASQTRHAPSWTYIMDVLLDARGLSGSEQNATKLSRELAEFVNDVRQTIAASPEAPQLAQLIHDVIAYLDEPTFRRMYPQYTQGDFLERTINQCSQWLSEARARSEGWKEAIDDILGINSVPIMTIAKSKGLEFHAVIVLGLEDFAFHHPDGNPAEEECNFFVGFSRAKERVVFTFAERRSGHWQSRKKISKYYELLGAAGVDIEEIRPAKPPIVLEP